MVRSLRTANASPRTGITLLEVIVSLAIFLGSLVAIGQLISLGSERAIAVHDEARGLQLCRCKLAELSSGVEPLSSGSASIPEDERGNSSSGDTDWQVRWTVADDSIPNLKLVQVWATRGSGARTTEVTLAQKLLDPNARGNTADKLQTSASASP